MFSLKLCRRVHLADQGLRALDDETFEDVWHLLGKIVGEHATVAAAGEEDLVFVDAQLGLDLGDKGFHEEHIIEACGPGALTAFTECLAAIVAHGLRFRGARFFLVGWQRYIPSWIRCSFRHEVRHALRKHGDHIILIALEKVMHVLDIL